MAQPYMNQDQLNQIIKPLEGWCTEEKAWRLVDLVRERSPKVIVESGVFGGKSLIPLALAAREVGSIAYGIDPWRKDAALEGNEADDAHNDWWSKLDMPAIYRGFVEAVHREGLLENLTWFREKGERACRFFDDGEIDFFHLDSNHSEEVSLREVEMWHPKLAQSCIWIMDDVGWPTQQKAVERIKSLGFVEKFNDGNYAIFERE